MDLDSIGGMMGGLMPYGLVGFLGLILAILAGVMMVVGNRVNPGHAAAGVGLTAVGSAVAAWLSLPVDLVAPEAFEAVQLASFTRFAAWFGVTAVGFCGLAVLAIAGAKNPERDVKAAMAGGVAVALVVALSVGSGYANAEWGAGIFFHIRAVEYAVLGAMVPVAMVGTTGSSQDAGAAAGVSFALIVATCEVAGRGVTHFFLMSMIGGAPMGDRAEIIRVWFENTGGEVPWMLATTAAGCLVAILATAMSARGGNTRAWAGLLWLPVVLLVWLGGHLTAATCTAIALALP